MKNLDLVDILVSPEWHAPRGWDGGCKVNYVYKLLHSYSLRRTMPHCIALHYITILINVPLKSFHQVTSFRSNYKLGIFILSMISVY